MITSLLRSSTLLAASLAFVASGNVQAGILTFEGLPHGAVISTAGNSHGAVPFAGFALPAGLASIRAVNVGGGPQIGVAYDSNLDPDGEDPDLESPWDRGNLAPGTDLGMLAIVQENATDCDTGTCSSADDEGSRPAGSLILEFEGVIDSIGMDLIDVEGPSEFDASAGFVATFLMGGQALAQVGFGAFIDPLAPAFFDPTVVFGNNSANRIAPVTAAALGIGGFDRVEFNFGGSAAIDNIVWTEVPAPGVLSLLLPGLAGGFAAARRRR